MITPRTPNPLIEALIISSITSVPFAGAMLAAALPESIVLRLASHGRFGAILGAVLHAKGWICLAGGSLMLGICLGAQALSRFDWADGLEAAFGIFGHPWLQLCSTYIWLGLLLLLVAPLERRILAPRLVLAGVDSTRVITLILRTRYCTFALLALLWLWRCWHFAQRLPHPY